MVLEFGAFQLDVQTSELRKDGKPVRLQPQPVKVLALLAANAGSLVTREQIRSQIWSGDTFVDFEQGLNYCIAQIRSALGDRAKSPQYIETLQRRGYRFLAPVRDATTAAPELGGKILLAVLPFENLSGEAEQEFFSDGLTEEMITALGRVNPQRLGVIARTSAMRYKGRARSIDQVARELGVSYVLEGSVRRGGDRVRVTAQLVQASDQSNVWSDAFDRGLGDMLALQSELASSIAHAIRIRLSPAEEKRIASRRPIAPDAYELYLKGRYLWNTRTRDGLSEAARCFEQAIERHQDYAAAYAGLADVHLTQLDYNYLLPRDAFALANRAVLEALRLDDTLADPHTSLGHLRLHEFNWRAAEQEFTRAIDFNPSYATAHYYYGNLLVALGRSNEAVAEARRVLEIDPMSANARQNLAQLLYFAGRYDEALKQCADANAIEPQPNSDYLAGLINERRGRYDEAMRVFEGRWPASSRSRTTVAAAVGFVHAQAGRRDEALQVRNRLEALAEHEYVSSYDLALLYLALGDPDQAVERLWRAHEEYSSMLPYVNVDARFDPLRTHPGFRALIERMRFPPRPERRAAAAADDKKIVIAVLPFENLSGEADQEFFSDGLTEDMIAQLGRINPARLGVIARTSAMKYKAGRKTVSEIGRDLGAAYLVEGSVRRSGSRMRVVSQLVRTADQTQVWSHTFERELTDVLALQGELATAIAREVRVSLAPQEAQRLARIAPIEPQAHEAYLKGRYFWNKRTEEAMKQGIACFEEAIRFQPDYAAAYDGISDSYVMLACRGVLPVRQTFQQARDAARKALEIDPSLGEAHASLAHVRLHDWDWTGLDEDFRRALELSPGHAIAHYWYSEYLMTMGRADEAVTRVDEAHRMDPLSAVLGASQGMIRYLARRYEEAGERLRQALVVEPNHFLLHFRLGLVQIQKGMTRQAIEEMETAVRLSGRSTETLTGLAQAYAAARMPEAMAAVIGELEAQTGLRYVSPYNMARVFAAAEEPQHAFVWLERAFDEHNPDLIELRNDAVFDPLRSDSRFATLLARVGWRTEAPRAAATGKLVIAVLPFENLSGDAAQEFFSDGLTDEMITQLGLLNPERLAVIARTSAMIYKSARKSVQLIGRELGVSHIVEGTVRRAGDRVRASAKLVDVSSQTQVWAETYDRDLGDILRLQGDLASAIAGAIHLQLTPGTRQRLDRSRSVDPDAYEQYLRGRFLWNQRTQHSIEQAIGCQQNAIAIDPAFALAFSALGDCYVVLGSHLWIPPQEAASRGGEACRRALELDPALAEPHAALGFVRSQYQYRWDDAAAEFRRALQINSNYATAHHWQAFYLSAVGRLQEAVAAIRVSERLDPLSPIIRTNVGTVLFWARDFDTAVEQYRDVLRHEPNFWVAHWMLGLAYEQQGHVAAAVEQHRKAIDRCDAPPSGVIASLARALALRDERAEAARLLAHLSSQTCPSLFHMAAAHAVLGDRDAAFDCLRRGRDQGESWIAFVNVDARMDPLRDDPRFGALIQSMQFP